MKTLVIKVGGAFLDSAEKALPLLHTLLTLQQSARVVLVHGGGNAVEKLLHQLGQSSVKINGLRVTPDTQIGYIVGALAGTANKQLCGLAIQTGLNPVGLCLADGKTTISEVVSPALGRVGQVVSGHSALLELLLNAGYLPIVSSIGADEQGDLLNVNADQAATALAKLLHADLYLLSDVVGVLDQNKSLITTLDNQQLSGLIESGVVRDGMTVKVQAAQEAADTLGRPVTIASWAHPQAVFNEANTTKFSGTKILPTQLKQDGL